MNTRPEALRLADVLDDEEFNMSSKDIFDAAAELRRLHDVNQMLVEALEKLAILANEGTRISRTALIKAREKA